MGIFLINNVNSNTPLYETINKTNDIKIINNTAKETQTVNNKTDLNDNIKVNNRQGNSNTNSSFVNESNHIRINFVKNEQSNGDEELLYTSGHNRPDLLSGNGISTCEISKPAPTSSTRFFYMNGVWNNNDEAQKVADRVSSLIGGKDVNLV